MSDPQSKPNINTQDAAGDHHNPSQGEKQSNKQPIDQNNNQTRPSSLRSLIQQSNTILNCCTVCGLLFSVAWCSSGHAEPLSSHGTANEPWITDKCVTYKNIEYHPHNTHHFTLNHMLNKLNYFHACQL